MNRYQLIFLGLVSTFMCGCSIAGPVEEKWGAPLEGPFGLKEYVVAILSAKSQPDFGTQKLQVAKPTADLLSVIDVMPLLYAYDSLGSERDVEDLAKLSAYYLGESAGTLYRCLLLRKGQKIQSALKKLVVMKSNECIQRFGLDVNVCLQEEEYRASLTNYIETISNLTKTRGTIPTCSTTGWSSM